MRYSSYLNQTLHHRYEVRELIGEGGMGQVFRVWDRQARTERALKLIDTQRKRYPLESVFRFQTEAQTLRELQHPAIVRYLDFFHEEHVYALVMELLPEPTLREVLHRDGPLANPDLLLLALELSRALWFVHERQRVHHDIKSVNLKVDLPQRRVKLLDFGLAELLRGTSQHSGGTLAYMAPERTGILHKQVDHRADLYSLGVLLYEAATGHVPFRANDPSVLIHQHIARAPDPPTQQRPDLHPQLEAIILHLLNKDPDDRYRTTLGLLRDLERLEREGLRQTLRFALAEDDHWNSLPLQIPLVGRNAELQQLATLAAEVAAQQSGRLLLIEGEDGLGKTRLLQEFRNRWEQQGRACWFPNTHAEETDVPYQFFRACWRDMLEHLRNIPEEQQRALVNLVHEQVDHLTPLFLEFAPELRTWSNLVEEKYHPLHHLDVPSTPANYHEMILRTMRIVGAHKPFAVLVDDLPRLDSASQQFFAEQWPALVNIPALWVFTLHPPDTPEAFQQLRAAQAPHLHFLSLEPLREVDYAELLRKYFQNRFYDLHSFLGRLHSATQGHPEALRVLLQQLIDEGTIYYHDHAWRLHQEALSQRIHDFERSQIETLGLCFLCDEQDRDVLCRAAVFQRAFYFEALVDLIRVAPALATPETRLPAILDRMLQRGILHIDNRQLYAFRDGRVRIALRNELAEETRQRCHTALAQFLERHYLADDPDAIYDIAHHWGKSHDPQTALEYYLLAAQHSQQKGAARQQVVLYYRLALDALRQLPAEAISAARQFELRKCVLQQSFFFTLQFDQLAQEVAEMGRFVQDDAARRWVHVSLLAQVSAVQGRKADLERYAQQVLNEADPQRDREALARVKAYLGMVATERSYSERIALLDQAIQSLRQQMLHENAIGLVNIRTTLLCYQCRFAEAEERIDEAVEWMHRTRQPFLDIVAIFLRSFVASERGDFPAVLKMLAPVRQMLEEEPQRAEQLKEYMGRAGQSQIHILVAQALAMTGQLQTALNLLEPLLEPSQQNEQRFERGAALLVRCKIALFVQENPQLTLTYLEQGFAQMRARPDRLVLTSFLFLEAWAHTNLQQYAPAQVALEQAQQTAHDLDALQLQLMLRFLALRLHWFREHDKALLAEARDALEEFVAAGLTGYYELASEDMKSWKNVLADTSSNSSITTGQSGLYQLMDINRQISSTLDQEQLFPRILEGAMRLSGAEQGYLFVFDERCALDDFGNADVLRATCDTDGKPLPASQQRFVPRVLQTVLDTRHTFILRDARNEYRWRDDEVIQQHQLRSILATPIVLRQQIKGILYLDNRQASALFTQQDQELVELFAVQVAVALNNARMYEAEQHSRKQLESTLQVFERFVPRQFTRDLGSGEVEGLQAGMAKQATMSILFSDIRSFTSISEQLSPEALFAMLNEYLHHMEVPIRRQGGFVDKFIGDAVMALFEREPLCAVNAALGMQQQLQLYNSRRVQRGEKPLQAGIGIHTGEVTKGVIGSSERFDTTVIGDTVNTASRLESLTKLYGCSLLISGETLAALPADSTLLQRRVDVLQVKGRSQPTVLIEVFEGDLPQLRMRKQAMLSTFEDAFQLYQAGQWTAAHRAFRAYHNDFPEDRLGLVFLERCTHFLADSPVAWDGTYAIAHK